jgi:hypothetical protein
MAEKEDDTGCRLRRHTVARMKDDSNIKPFGSTSAPLK